MGRIPITPPPRYTRTEEPLSVTLTQYRPEAGWSHILRGLEVGVVPTVCARDVATQTDCSTDECQSWTVYVDVATQTDCLHCSAVYATDECQSWTVYIHDSKNA